MLPIIICSLSFLRFIDVPFDHYDIWFERIAYNDIQKDQLPQIFKDLDAPVGVKEYIKYRTIVIGRLFGMIGPVYFSFAVFGENATLWRLFLFLLVFITLYVSDRIMAVFGISGWKRVFVGLILVTLFSRYYIKTISVIYGVANLILLMAFYLELVNSRSEKVEIKRSCLAAALFFLALFTRELFAASIPSFIFLLLTESNKGLIRFRVNLSRIVPYIVCILSFLLLYVIFTNDKVPFAYSNDLNLSLWSGLFIQQFAFYFLNFIGFGYSAILGAMILVFLIFLFLMVLITSRKKHFTPVDIWFVMLAILVIAPVCLVLFVIGHATGSFSHQYLFGCIFVVLSLDILLNKISNTTTRRWLPSLFYLVCSMILVLRFSFAMQEVEYFSKHASVYSQMTERCSQLIRSGDTVILSDDIGYQESFAIITDIFLRSKRSDISFHQKGELNSDYDNYLKYFLSPLYNKPRDIKPTFLISRCNCALQEGLYQRIITFEQVIRNYFPYKFFNRYKNSSCLDILSKTAFGISANNLVSMYVPSVKYCLSY